MFVWTHAPYNYFLLTDLFNFKLGTFSKLGFPFVEANPILWSAPYPLVHITPLLPVGA